MAQGVGTPACVASAGCLLLLLAGCTTADPVTVAWTVENLATDTLHYEIEQAGRVPHVRHGSLGPGEVDHHEITINVRATTAHVRLADGSNEARIDIAFDPQCNYRVTAAWDGAWTLEARPSECQ